MSLPDPTYAELERQVAELEDAMTANDELMQRVEELNAQLLAALKGLVRVGTPTEEYIEPDLDAQDTAFAEAEEAIKHAEAFQP